MYARVNSKAEAVHRSSGGHSLREFNFTRDLLLLGSLLALLLRVGAGAG